jgi:hypothetical protein
MQAARRFIQTIRFILLGAIVVYGLLVLQLRSSATSKPIVLHALTVLAVSLVVLLFVIRRIQVLPAEAILEKQPQDAKALMRWRQGYLVTYCLSMSIALYGLVLHFLGFSMSQVGPFFVAGIVLILFLSPKVIPDGTSQSGPIAPL